METAYYYFFSAVPQVLSGIIALFGVFVLFKLQALSNELSPIVETLYKALRFPFEPDGFHEKKEIRVKLAKLCIDAFGNKSFKTISDYITTFDNKIFSNYPNYTINLERFKVIYTVYQDLLGKTIFATIFTGIIIIICLLLLPFGKFLSCNYNLIFSLILIIIILVSIVFSLLITILKKSLR